MGVGADHQTELYCLILVSYLGLSVYFLYIFNHKLFSSEVSAATASLKSAYITNLSGIRANLDWVP